MEQVLDIQAEGSLVGQIHTRDEGLYYCFDCRIYPPDQGKYRLIARGEDEEYDFGIFIPWENGMRIRTRIPIKRFIKGKVVFEAVKEQANPQRNFIAICAEKPFAYLPMLENAKLVKDNGEIGIYVTV